MLKSTIKRNKTNKKFSICALKAYELRMALSTQKYKSVLA